MIKTEVSTVSISRSRNYAIAAFLFGFTTSLIMVLAGWRGQGFVASSLDPYYFGEMGRSLSRGEGFAAYGSLLHRRAPLYPGFIGGVYSLVGEHIFAIQLAHCVFYGLTALIAFDIGRRLFNQRTGMIAALLVALSPAGLRYAPVLHLETFLAFLNAFTIWWTVRFYERPTLGNGIGTGIAAGLAALTKPVVAIYPALFAIWFLWTFRKRGDRAAQTPVAMPLAAIFVFMVLVISPWTLRNYRVTGHFVPITTGLSDAFLRGYIFSKPEYALLRRPPYTDAENECNAYVKEICRRSGVVWQQDDYVTDKLLNVAAVEKLKSEPAEFVRKFLTQMLTFWYQMTSLPNSIITGGAALAFWILALMGWRRARAEGRPAWLLFLPVLFLNVQLAMLIAVGRYSSAVLPFLMVLAAFGVDSILGNGRAVPAAEPETEAAVI